MTIDGVLKKIAEAEKGFHKEITKSLENAKGFIKTELIQGQLYAGVTGDLIELTPSYLDDPFFVEMTDNPDRTSQENRNAAIRYAEWWRDWKLRITPPSPNPELNLPARDVDTPNLVIIGTFYDSIYVRITERAIEIGTTGVDFGIEIEHKYGSEIFKLSPNAVKWLVFEHVKPDLEGFFFKLGFKQGV